MKEIEITLKEYLRLKTLEGFFKGFMEGIQHTLQNPEHNQFVIAKCDSILKEFYGEEEEN